MKLWRLVRKPFVALDGSGPLNYGGRYSSPGRPVVNFASEAGLAVLISLRYATDEQRDSDAEYLLGWTQIDAEVHRVPDELDDVGKTAHVDAWLDEGRSLLIAVRSAVLPEADVVLMNIRHPSAARVPPLTVRPFRFSECLHRPPMLDHYR